MLREIGKIMEAPGFEPGAFRMQSGCDTTTPRPQSDNVKPHYNLMDVFITLQLGKYNLDCECLQGFMRVQLYWVELV